MPRGAPALHTEVTRLGPRCARRRPAPHSAGRPGVPQMGTARVLTTGARPRAASPQLLFPLHLRRPTGFHCCWTSQFFAAWTSPLAELSSSRSTVTPHYRPLPNPPRCSVKARGSTEELLRGRRGGRCEGRRFPRCCDPASVTSGSAPSPGLSLAAPCWRAQGLCHLATLPFQGYRVTSSAFLQITHFLGDTEGPPYSSLFPRTGTRCGLGPGFDVSCVLTSLQRSRQLREPRCKPAGRCLHAERRAAAAASWPHRAGRARVPAPNPAGRAPHAPPSWATWATGTTARLQA